MRLKVKALIFLATITLLLILWHASTTALGANQVLSDADTAKKYGFTFPIADLGNCNSIDECGAYCRKDGNLPACMQFVKKYQITKDDVLSFTISELGSCQVGSDCRNFCRQPPNRTKCIDFADKYDLLSASNIELARKFTEVVGSGGPGGCRTLEQCDQYCDDSSHTNECLDYVGKKKLLPEDLLNATRKVAEGFREGIETPGKCYGITECNNYCGVPSHVGECSVYATKVGYFSGQQAAEAQKFSSLVSQGATPGGCSSKESCESYCASIAHTSVCSDFALSAGLLSKADAEAIKQYGGSGPGNCKSKEDCSGFCNKGENQQICLQFAKDHNINVSFNGPGGCSDADSCKTYCMAHTDDATCKQYAGQAGGFKGPGGCTDQTSCTAYCQQHTDDSECQKMASQYGANTKGPGGCNSKESCTQYCTAHQSDPECQKMAGQYGGGFSGPGGCNSQDSCMSYCKANYKDPACAQLGGSQYQQQMQQYQQPNQQQNQQPPH